MNNSRFDNRSGDGRGSFRRDSGRPVLHDAVCDECGKDCRVPFRPSGGKPVFCSECFEKKGGRGNNRSGRGSYKPRYGDRDSRRSSQRNVSGPDFSQLTKNIEILNNKLDTIIALLGSGKKKKTDSVVVKAKKDKKKKTRKIKDSEPKTKTKVKKTPKKSSSKVKIEDSLIV